MAITLCVPRESLADEYTARVARIRFLSANAGLEKTDNATIMRMNAKTFFMA